LRQAQFKKLCTGCPLRERCTTSKTGRVLRVHPQHRRLADDRAQAADPVTYTSSLSCSGHTNP
jgi:hypothetical protein